LGNLIDEEYAWYVREALPEVKIAGSELVRLLIRKRPRQKRVQEKSLSKVEERYERLHETLAGTKEFRIDVCANMIGNTICADLLDYLYRDWYHVGKPRTFEDRILQYMEIRTVDPSEQNAMAEPRAEEPEYVRSVHDRFVISLGASPKIRTDGVSAILGLLEWRYELAETVLFHRTKVTAAAMLDRALFELWGIEDETAIVKQVLQLSDEQLIDYCLTRATKELSESAGKAERLKALEAAIANLKGIKTRNLMTSLCTWTVDKLGADQIEEIKELYGGEGHVNRTCATRRTQALRHLEDDFGLASGSLAMYCAEAKPKIAEVAIAVGKRIEKFDEYERRTDGKLSGGHLEAQNRRFRRLWRVAFLINRGQREVLEKKGLLVTLQNVIESLVLPKGDNESRLRDAHGYARAFVADQRLPWASHELIISEQALAMLDARRASHELTLEPCYPTGAPCIRSFLRAKIKK
jgi:hypothetical protein